MKIISEIITVSITVTYFQIYYVTYTNQRVFNNQDK